jgi:hypothetical protein
VLVELSGPLVAADPMAVTRIAGFDGVLDALLFVQPEPGVVPSVTVEVITAIPGDSFGVAAGAVYTIVRLDGAPGAVLDGAFSGLANEIGVTSGTDARGFLGLGAVTRADFLVA